MDKNAIAIFGSINIDKVFYLRDFPKKGETIFALDAKQSFGGKGSNQAIALAKLGSKTIFIGAVGDDSEGEQSIKNLQNNEVECSFVQTIKNVQTGVATIFVNSQSENTIVVNSGANLSYLFQNESYYKQIWDNTSFLVAQLEMDLKTTLKIFQSAKRQNITTIFNPAPLNRKLPNELLKLTDYLILNEVEAEYFFEKTIVSRDDLSKLFKKFNKDYPQTDLIVTLGSKGVCFFDNKKFVHLNAKKVKAVDTTGAGDCFIGALTDALNRKLSLNKAINFANKVAALCVQQKGAQIAIPTFKEIES